MARRRTSENSNLLLAALPSDDLDRLLPCLVARSFEIKHVLYEPGNPIPLTQEFVAMMLGASRPSVTIVAGTLQNAGLIRYRRGHVTVVDREGLEGASCECYQTATTLLRKSTDGNGHKLLGVR